MSEPEIIGPGDFYEEPRRGIGALGTLLAVTGGLLAVAVLAGGVWFAYEQGIRSGAEDAAPVIRAAESPIKRQPANPGGLDVPHQDKLVFGRLAPGQIQEPVERLLPPPEEPAERPRLAETPAVSEPAPPEPASGEPANIETPGDPGKPETAVEEMVFESMAAPPEVPTPPSPAEPAEAADSEPAAAVAEAPPPAPPAPSEPEVTQKPEPTSAAATPPPAPAVAPVDAWRIQLAAVSSRASAVSEWDRLKNRNADLLGTLDLNVQSVKLDSGTFYRIQAGPLADGPAARSLCDALKGRNQACLIVAP